jgi:hypothetical protein
MKKTYIYKGEVETYIPGVGIVYPNQEIEMEKEIRNLLFEEKKEEKKENKEKKKKN